MASTLGHCGGASRPVLALTGNSPATKSKSPPQHHSVAPHQQQHHGIARVRTPLRLLRQPLALGVPHSVRCASDLCPAACTDPGLPRVRAVRASFLRGGFVRPRAGDSSLLRLQRKHEASAKPAQGGQGGKAAVAEAQALGAETATSATPSAATSATEASDTWALPPVKAPKRVVLVRHGESTWNASGRIQGSSDFSELTEKGEGQAETSRQMLASDNFDICFHSPLQRSAKTARIIWGKRAAPMEPIDDLREIDLYSFQGLFKEQGKERYGAQYRMWQQDAANFEIDGHFPVRELWARARHCWDVMLTSEAESILVVAHNAVNQALVATAMGLGPSYFRTLLQSNCGVSVLDFTPCSSPSCSSLLSLNRLNQTPSPPVGVQSAGRKAKSRVILVCHGMTDSGSQKRFPSNPQEQLNMLGVLQSRKTSELLLDVRVDSIFCSPCPCAVATASAVREVQEAAECLGADCVPRFVDVVPLDSLKDFDYGPLQGQDRPGGLSLREALAREGGESLDQLQGRSREAWGEIRRQLAETERTVARLADLDSASDAGAPETPPSGTVLAVSHVMTIKAMVSECLGISAEEALAFNIDQGGICVVDLPDGAQGRGVVRCLNYTAHLGRWAVPVTSPTFYDESF